MGENQKGNKWIIIVAVVIFILLLGSCGGESDYEKDARSGFDKWSSGDYGSMTDDEKDAVNDFLEWSDKN